ncbi:FecR family protein [Sinomicrobium sp. M5D2P9]
MNREKEIEILFKKFRDNTISEEEYHRLMDWIKESGSESRMQKWMDEHWEGLKKNQDHPEREIVSDTRFEQMLEKADKRRRIHRPGNGKTGYRYYQVAAILVLLLSVSGIWYYQNKEEPLPPPAMVTQHISSGEKATITLPDGTVVRLNSNTELVFPDRFSGNAREVMLRGEAFFEVVKDKEHPFLVKTGELTTRVLGTSFNVKAYENEEEVEVSVATGLVEVSKGKTGKENEEKQHVLLNPSQQAVYREDDQDFITREVDIASIAIWKDGILSFNRTPLDQAAKMLERWYGVKVILKNPGLKKCVITGDHKNQGLSSVLHSFQYSLGVSYEITKDTVIINGKNCTR